MYYLVIALLVFYGIGQVNHWIRMFHNSGLVEDKKQYWQLGFNMVVLSILAALLAYLS